ncbi:MAG: hypothetical protein PHQ58_04890 [Rhodoferax sp.]|uniref:hypothetical protein n=1 Tax=Rhodoferax sp. TaxID=50421 RepID=UPI0026154A22|nr:hypothetical protein [Rhodoferax sp.]MDD2879750.1 hypothetical protein [Rhodoferax sp.]
MAIRQFNSLQKNNYPAVSLTKKDPKLAAMISKMTTSMHGTTRDELGNRKTLVANTFAFRSLLQKRARRNADAQAILRLLPDIELSAQILVSSILSPKDMTSMELLYMGPKNLFSPELSASLLNRMKEHFEETYNIKAQLTEMLRDPLFEKGSYPIAVIPENAIDDFINGNKSISTEALKEFVNPDGNVRNIGLLGPHDGKQKSRVGIMMESYYGTVDSSKVDQRIHYQSDDIGDYRNYVAEDYLVVVDNPVVLKFPKLNEKTKSQAVKRQYARNNMGIAIESIAQVPDSRVEQAIYRNRQYNTEPVATLKKPNELKRRSVGGPLVMKLPSESVIPVHVPGNVKKHIGYFVILDEEGNPVEVPDGDEYHNGLNNANSAGNSLASNLIRKVESNLGNANTFDPMNNAHLDFASRVYADMIERDLISRIKNGVYASSASLARNEEVYRIMLSRVLAKKYTQILYLPSEFMTYIAFKYGDDGIGRSLLDDTAMINTLRSIMLFTDVMASVKNSIGRTKVTANVPESDPDPMKTLELAQDEIVRSRMLGIPLGVSSPGDILEFIQRAGYEWEIGGHPGLPDLKFEFQQTNTSYTKPDTDLQDLLRKSSIMAFGLSPETVDNGFNTEFATTAVANNILLSKRVSLMQDIFTPLLSDHLRKVASNTEELLVDLKAILEDNPKGINLEVETTNNNPQQTEGTQGELADKLVINKALNEFLEKFYVELPKPSSVTLENQLADLRTYSDALDAALDAYISDGFFTTSTAGEVSNEANTIRALIKSYFIRKWLSDKGVLPELAELTANDEAGNPQLNLMSTMTDHVQALVRSGITALAKLAPIVQAANKDMEAMNVEPSDNSSTSDTGDSGDDSGMGGDDFGFDDGMGDAGGDVESAPGFEIPSGEEAPVPADGGEDPGKEDPNDTEEEPA